MSDWAENECRIACGRENSNFDFNNNSEDNFDYGCSCYKSALKAYKSLCGDGHPGFSFNEAKHILERLMDGLPLTPIKDEDFFINQKDMPPSLEPEEYLIKRGLKSDIQCPRMSSLFREESLDGEVNYHDIDRYYFVNIENPSDTYHSSADFLDKMFPITMPYMPTKEKFKIYEQTFLTDKEHGDFDTKGIFYMVTPDGERIDLNIYKTEGDDGKWKEITKSEYDELLQKRIDKLCDKVADHLIWTLISNSADEDEIARREEKYKEIDNNTKEMWFLQLSAMCRFFENSDNWQYNTFSMRQALCKGNLEKYKQIPPLCAIAEHLKGILDDLG